jgi:hypothetical protein
MQCDGRSEKSAYQIMDSVIAVTNMWRNRLTYIAGS